MVAAPPEPRREGRRRRRKKKKQVKTNMKMKMRMNMKVKKKKKKKPQTKSSSDGATETRPTKSLMALTGGGEAPDSGDRKTCHQCRQRTMGVSASCKATRRGKPCPHHFCYKCLKNRYGENAATAAAMADWSCPKCRGICNCSFCMRKRGRPPTGVLSPIARSSGFSSVSEMLLLGGGGVGQAEAAPPPPGDGGGAQILGRSVAAGSSREEPIDVDEEQELLRRREMERDREIDMLKEEIAALEAAVEALEAAEPGGGAA